MTRPMGSRPWTPEEEDLLRTLIERSASMPLIVAKLKRTAAAVRVHASIIGVSLKRIKPVLKATGK
jgi:hypothetical protein